MIVYACSTNRGKLAEFALAAELEGCQLKLLPRLEEIAPPEETGETFEANAALKAVYYSNFTPEIVLADDSGLAVDALNGKPGVNSARYAGLHASATANNDLLLRNLAGVSDRRAHFECVIALAQHGRILESASDIVEGEILSAPRGSHGFGYDPLFFYPPLNRSFGELSDEEKLWVSARGRALRKIFAAVSSMPNLR